MEYMLATKAADLLLIKKRIETDDTGGYQHQMVLHLREGVHTRSHVEYCHVPVSPGSSPRCHVALPTPGICALARLGPNAEAVFHERPL